MFEFEWMIPLQNADGDIGAASGGDTDISEPPSVAAGDEPATGSAPAAASGEEGTEEKPDVTQQESFATRLREERSKLEEQYKPVQTRHSRIEEVAKLSGFENVDDYLEALDAHARQQHAANEAKRLNVDEETYQQYFAPLNEDLNRTKQELQTLKQAEAERAVKADFERLMATHSDFESVQDKVLDIAYERRLPLEDAYKLVVFDERMNAAKLEGQQEAIQKLQTNNTSSTGALGGDSPDQKFDFTKLSPDERQKYYERAKRGELKSLR